MQAYFCQGRRFPTGARNFPKEVVQQNKIFLSEATGITRFLEMKPQTQRNKGKGIPQKLLYLELKTFRNLDATHLHEFMICLKIELLDTS